MRAAVANPKPEWQSFQVSKAPDFPGPDPFPGPGPGSGKEIETSFQPGQIWTSRSEVSRARYFGSIDDRYPFKLAGTQK